MRLLSNLWHSRPFSTMGLPLKSVLDKLQKIAPLRLAEPWDNVGLLVQPERQAQVSTVLLTIDLTEDVVAEAQHVGAQLIVSYHPNIFKPLKSLTQSSWKERVVVECIRSNIAVYSPHTSWDAIKGGVNDWLGAALPHSASRPILPSAERPDAGAGRLLTLGEALSLRQVLALVKTHIGLGYLRLGLGRGGSLESQVGTVALCAGSGATVLANVEADLYLTGEMSHHDVLEATQRGVHVVLCNHSDSERGFLKVVQPEIAAAGLQVKVSEVDRDCLTTI
ncbi:hypothetical protein HUJ04_000137 [Dendroctonus ponderosae]